MLIIQRGACCALAASWFCPVSNLLAIKFSVLPIPRRTSYPLFDVIFKYYSLYWRKYLKNQTWNIPPWSNCKLPPFFESGRLGLKPNLVTAPPPSGVWAGFLGGRDYGAAGVQNSRGGCRDLEQPVVSENGFRLKSCQFGKYGNNF